MIKDEIQAAFGFHMDSDRIAHNFANNGNVGRSGFCDNKLLVCAGLLVPWHGLGIAWALLSVDAAQHRYFVHKAVVEGLQYFIYRLKLKRIEANVNELLPQAKSWVRHLGFVEESVMPLYGPSGETFIKYVMFP